jgi:hypothetical protein
MFNVLAAAQYTRCDPEMLLSYRGKANAKLMRASRQLVVGTTRVARVTMRRWSTGAGGQVTHYEKNPICS